LTADKAKTASLLNYHVVPGKVSYADLAGRTSITTVDGRTLPVARQADGTINVGGAKVLGQGIDSSNGIIYPVDSVLMPPGFVMPQAAQGFPWWLIPLVLLGLGALALYLMTRPRRHAEPTPRRRYAEQPPAEKARPGYEERARTEETRRPQETMMATEPVSVHREPQIADIAKNLSLPLSGVALTGLNALISKGTFSDKQDFVGYLAKTFMANNLGSAMAGGKEPSESMIMDIIGKTGIARGFSSDDTKNMLVPLLITGFTAVYNYLNKRPEARTT
ncbi:MAG TPA: fasciclin domain-containing protein, partial [Methanocella sp.]